MSKQYQKKLNITKIMLNKIQKKLSFIMRNMKKYLKLKMRRIILRHIWISFSSLLYFKIHKQTKHIHAIINMLLAAKKIHFFLICLVDSMDVGQMIMVCCVKIQQRNKNLINWCQKKYLFIVIQASWKFLWMLIHSHNNEFFLENNNQIC